MDLGFKDDRPLHPRSSIFEKLIFWWTIKLFKTGQRRELEVNDLYSTLDDHASSTLGKEFEKIWRKQIANAKRTNRQPCLLRALLYMFGPRLMLNGVLLFIGEIILRMIQPVCIDYLISYFDSPSNTDLYAATVATIAFILSLLVCTVGLHQHLFGQCVIGYKMRIAVTTVVYSKVLRLSKTALGEITGGQLVNLLSNDVNRFDSASLFLHFLWVGPLKTIVVTYFLWQEVGVSSIFGVGTLLAFVPLQGWLSKKVSGFRQKTAARTDVRMRLMNEIISNMQVIKMYTWERLFEYLVQFARNKEIRYIKGSAYVKSVLLSFGVFSTRIALFFTIFSYVLLGNDDITAKKVFVMISYYDILRTTMTVFFPQGVAQTAELLVSVERLRTFLLLEENHDQAIDRSNGDGAAGKPSVVGHESEIVITNGRAAKWTDNYLENINLTVGGPGRRLTAIVGRAGAGKSALLEVMLGESPLSEGSVSVRDVVSYASQEPWLFAGTVQQNVLFGLPMDDERYGKVINACALKTDLERFPRGDKTVVGERGVSLSGGQKARINLARALYRQADIYLLDDPLSAVDTYVGKHIFEKCIKGFLEEKTCVFVTDQLRYLTEVDKIVLMQNASILADGSYQELEASLGSDFTKLLDASVEPDMLSENECTRAIIVNSEQPQDFIKTVSPCVGDPRPSGSREALPEVAEEADTCSSWIVTRDVFSSYFSAGGSACKISALWLLCIFAQVLASSVDYWIMLWVDLEVHYFYGTYGEESYDMLWWSISRQSCIVVFAALTFSMIVVTLTRSVVFVSVCMQASTNLHNKMFNAITRTTMYFFNTNSAGRILNRFSKDMDAIDDMLPCIMIDCIQIGLALVGVVIVVGLVNVYLMILTVVVGMIFYKVRVFYLATSRCVKRLEEVARSPVFAHLNASMQGLTTIRSFGAEHILSKEFNYHQDLHSSAWYLFISSSRAFGLWLDLICVVYISIVTFSFLTFSSDTFGGVIGFIITQVIGLTNTLQWGMRQSTELENQMPSVKRILEYTNYPQESALESHPDKKPPKEWPQKGQITFKNVYLRYKHNSPHVLKNLNFRIESMEKVGIVGRTGAGKSSLIGALFRLALNEGSIIIDNIDINKLGLHELRSKLIVIPREPVLFSGTLRTNLDPFNEYPDHYLWNVLTEVELKNVIEDLPGGLNYKISEGGSNFSVGQRQLVCLARALVRNNTILVFDEATTNVDPQTDTLIQNTIRNKFRMCTVLTITHRLNTVMDSDKVLVMDAGKMVEFGHPFNLLKNSDGFLYNMVEQSGRVTADKLHRLAAESYDRLVLMAREFPIQLIDNDNAVDCTNKTP